ncbi:hypothetical protein Hanom_Chr03g00239331 [Helianthus anomalus]
MLDDRIREKQNHAKAEPFVIEYLEVYAFFKEKLPVNGSQQQTIHEEIDLVKPMPSSKKRKMTSVQPNVPNLLAEHTKREIVASFLSEVIHVGNFGNCFFH